jgi:hypothetical protein
MRVSQLAFLGTGTWRWTHEESLLHLCIRESGEFDVYAVRLPQSATSLTSWLRERFWHTLAPLSRRLTFPWDLLQESFVLALPGHLHFRFHLLWKKEDQGCAVGQPRHSHLESAQPNSPNAIPTYHRSSPSWRHSLSYGAQI